MQARVFKSVMPDGKEVELRFNRPTQKILQDAEFEFKKYWARCMRSGIMSQAEALKMMKQNNIWTEEDEQAILEHRTRIASLEKEFTEDLSEENGKALFAQIKRLRSDMQDINSKFTNIYENTAENMAGDYRLQYLAANCVVYNDTGKRVFKDVEELISRAQESIVSDSYSEALVSNFEINYGIQFPPTGELLPENRWLKSFEEKKTQQVAVVEEPEPVKASKKKK
jgi:hypothetical protein